MEFCELRMLGVLRSPPRISPVQQVQQVGGVLERSNTMCTQPHCVVSKINTTHSCASSLWQQIRGRGVGPSLCGLPPVRLGVLGRGSVQPVGILAKVPEN